MNSQNEDDLYYKDLISSYKNELTVLKHAVIRYKQETSEQIQQLYEFLRRYQSEFELKVEEEVGRRVEQIRLEREELDEARNNHQNLNLDLVPRLERLESRAEHLDVQLHLIEKNVKAAEARKKLKQNFRECFLSRKLD